MTRPLALTAFPPHTAFYSEDALADLQTKAAKDVASVLSGEAPVYPYNKLTA